MTDNQKGKAKHTYKDGIFRSLFNDKKVLLELYNALTGNDYPDGTKIEIVTLEDAIFNDVKNDLAFIIEDKFINLIEQQSTLSPNIPLRMLEYVAKEYRKMYMSKTIYSETLVKIPTPEFYVFYNGEKDAPPYQEQKLSDAFMRKCDTISLEVKVHVINVNLEKGAELLEKCRTLKEYSVFISKVRKYSRAYDDLDMAIDASIEECIRTGILAEYLKEHRGDVMSFLHVQLSQEERLEIREQDAEMRKAKEIAGKMKVKGMSNKEISDLTGLTTEEIELL